jgi:hypothetical protein
MLQIPEAKNANLVTPAKITSGKKKAASKVRAAKEPAPTDEDTTLDRIRRHQFLGAQIIALTEAEDQITAAAKYVHGKQPFALIRWRNYSHIGGHEIERVRDEFLALGMPADVVENEYQDAKRRYEEQKSECLRWEKAAGVDGINRQIKSIIKERQNIFQSFVDKPPATQKAASKLIFYILDFYDDSEFDEPARACLASIAYSLSMIENRP